MPIYRIEIEAANEDELEKLVADGRWKPEIVQDTDNPITVEHLEVYYDPEYKERDGKGFMVDNSDGSTGHRFGSAIAASGFIAEELERMEISHRT